VEAKPRVSRIGTNQDQSHCPRAKNGVLVSLIGTLIVKCSMMELETDLFQLFVSSLSVLFQNWKAQPALQAEKQFSPRQRLLVRLAESCTQILQQNHVDQKVQ
jgi:hypothetical protein